MRILVFLVPLDGSSEIAQLVLDTPHPYVFVLKGYGYLFASQLVGLGCLVLYLKVIVYSGPLIQSKVFIRIHGFQTVRLVNGLVVDDRAAYPRWLNRVDNAILK